MLLKEIKGCSTFLRFLRPAKARIISRRDRMQLAFAFCRAFKTDVFIFFLLFLTITASVILLSIYFVTNVTNRRRQELMLYRTMDWLKKFVLRLAAIIWDTIVLSYLTVYYITESVILTFTPSFLRSEKSLKGKVALITGGAGGVGQEIAIRLARNNAKVVVWDINEKALEKLKEKIESEGFCVHTYVVDVADRHNVYKNADLVKAEVGNVDLLINNAGIVCGQTFLDLPDHMIEKTYNTNILSHYWTTKSFLGDMFKRGQGHIVTIGSLTGMLGTYKCTDYAATKYATIGFHESLYVELKTHGQHNIKMTLVCPYFINTGMFAGCKPRTFPMLEARDVAKRVITAIKRDEVFVTMPAISRFLLPLKNFLPAKLCWAMLYRGIQMPQAMISMRQFQDAAAA